MCIDFTDLLKIKKPLIVIIEKKLSVRSFVVYLRLIDTIYIQQFLKMSSTVNVIKPFTA